MSEVKDFLDAYCRFANSTCSETGKNDELFRQRQQDLSKWLKGEFTRFDMAVSGLAGEAGEVADVWKKLKFHDKELNQEMFDKLVDELGDVYWYLAQASMALGISMDEIIKRNIAKLEKRHPHGFSKEYMKNK